MDLYNCPHCNTNGVLPMSGGRCPNCKRQLFPNEAKIPMEDDLRETNKHISYSLDQPTKEYSLMVHFIPEMIALLCIPFTFYITSIGNGLGIWFTLRKAFVEYILRVGRLTGVSVPIGALVGLFILRMFKIRCARNRQNAPMWPRRILSGWFALAPAFHFYAGISLVLLATHYSPPEGKKTILIFGLFQILLFVASISAGITLVRWSRGSILRVLIYIVLLIVVTVLPPISDLDAGGLHIYPLLWWVSFLVSKLLPQANLFVGAHVLVFGLYLALFISALYIINESNTGDKSHLTQRKQITGVGFLGIIFSKQFCAILVFFVVCFAMAVSVRNFKRQETEVSFADTRDIYLYVENHATGIVELVGFSDIGISKNDMYQARKIFNPLRGVTNQGIKPESEEYRIAHAQVTEEAIQFIEHKMPTEALAKYTILMVSDNYYTDPMTIKLLERRIRDFP